MTLTEAVARAAGKWGSCPWCGTPMSFLNGRCYCSPRCCTLAESYEYFLRTCPWGDEEETYTKEEWERLQSIPLYEP